MLWKQETGKGGRKTKKALWLGSVDNGYKAGSFEHGLVALLFCVKTEMQTHVRISI